MEKVEKLNVFAILENRVDELKLKDKSKAGTWIGDELIVTTISVKELTDRVVYIGYDFTGSKKMETKLRKILPDVIKGDRNFGRSIIDIMADKETSPSDQADMIDSNVDEFIDGHVKELSLFTPYRRR